MSNKHIQSTGSLPDNNPAMGRIFLPVDPLNPGETELIVSINGEAHIFPLGRLVTAPEAFCRLVVASGRADGYEPLEQEV